MRKSSWSWLLIFVVWLLFAPILSLAQNPQPSTFKAKLFISETEWDFGYVPEEGTATHIFQIKNLGKDSLFIYQVRPTCGCTTAPLDKDRLASGETANLKVNFNAKHFQGKVTKSVKIVCNDENLPFTSVLFSATVDSQNPVVKIEPIVVTFDSVKKDEKNQRIVKVKNIDTSALEIFIVEGGDNLIEHKIEKNSLAPNESTQIYLETKKDAPSGWFQTSLTLDFQGSEKIRYTIPIRGTIVDKK